MILLVIKVLVKKYQQLENEKRAKKGIKPRGLRVLVLGIPNVGKVPSLIE